jgi:hypothetical protein
MVNDLEMINIIKKNKPLLIQTTEAKIIKNMQEIREDENLTIETRKFLNENIIEKSLFFDKMLTQGDNITSEILEERYEKFISYLKNLNMDERIDYTFRILTEMGYMSLDDALKKSTEVKTESY